MCGRDVFVSASLTFSVTLSHFGLFFRVLSVKMSDCPAVCQSYMQHAYVKFKKTPLEEEHIC